MVLNHSCPHLVSPDLLKALAVASSLPACHRDPPWPDAAVLPPSRRRGGRQHSRSLRSPPAPLVFQDGNFLIRKARRLDPAPFLVPHPSKVLAESESEHRRETTDRAVAHSARARRAVATRGPGAGGPVTTCHHYCTRANCFIMHLWIYFLQCQLNLNVYYSIYLQSLENIKSNKK